MTYHRADSAVPSAAGPSRCYLAARLTGNVLGRRRAGGAVEKGLEFRFRELLEQTSPRSNFTGRFLRIGLAIEPNDVGWGRETSRAVLRRDEARRSADAFGRPSPPGVIDYPTHRRPVIHSCQYY